MEPLKLLLWDLDGTVWNGSLLESGSEANEARPEVVQIMSDAIERGIIHIAISHNPIGRVTEHLKNVGIVKYFIEVIANFDPKASQIRDKIIALGLRPTSCLFLDDNLHNREMARHLVPELQTINPTLGNLAALQRQVLKQSVSEIDRTQLYREKLERSDQLSKSVSHNEFLDSLNVQLTYVNIKLFENELSRRRDELCSRAHQLNYTREFSLGEQMERQQPRTIDSQINLCIFAADRYGDHGFIGYVEYHRDTRRVLKFVFSCRILNLGIESFVFHDLGLELFPIPSDAAYPIGTTKPTHISADANVQRVMNNSVELRRFPRILTGSMCYYQMFLHKLAEYQKFTVRQFSARVLADLCNRHMDGSFEIAVYYAFRDHMHDYPGDLIQQVQRLRDTPKTVIIVLPFAALSILQEFRSDPDVDAFYSGAAYDHHFPYVQRLDNLRERVYSVASENELIHIIDQEVVLRAELKNQGTKILNLKNPASNLIHFYSNSHLGTLADFVYKKMLQVHERGCFCRT